MKRPRIALPEINQNVSNYVKAVLEAGMDPIVISIQTKEHLTQGIQQEYLNYRDFHVEAYDGLLLPGGTDIDPSRYGEPNLHARNLNPMLDDLQLEVLDAFVQHQKPVLGVCRGQQLLNVYFGGTLIQHLADWQLHASGTVSRDLVHGSVTARGTWVESLYGTAFMHNSAHHQAVKKPGRGLVADSWCTEDETIESLHHDSLPIFGVQWHPERMCLDKARADTADGLKIFRYFSRICGTGRNPSELTSGMGI